MNTPRTLRFGPLPLAVILALTGAAKGCVSAPLGDIQVTTSKTTAIANGVDAITISLVLKDTDGDPYFSAGTQLLANGSADGVTPATANADNKGNVSFELRAVAPGTKHLSVRVAQENRQSLSGRVYERDLGVDVDFTPNPLAGYTVSLEGFPASVTAGAAIPDFTVKVLAPDGSVAPLNTTLRFEVIPTGGGLLATALTTLSATASATAGVATVHGASLCMEGVGAYTLRVFTASDIPGYADFSLVAGAPARIAVRNSLANPTPSPRGGSPWALEASVRDACGNVATSYAGTVTFSLPELATGAHSTLPPPRVVTTADEGAFTFSVTVDLEENDLPSQPVGHAVLTLQDAAAGFSLDYPLSVLPAPLHTVALEGVPTQAEVNAPITFHVRVTTPDGVNHPELLPEVKVTTTCSGGTLTGPDSTGNSGAVFPKVGTCAVTATRRGFTATSPVTVSDHGTFTVSAPASPPTAGVPFQVKVSLKSSNGTPIGAYFGTVHFTSSDPAAVLPADYTFTPSDSGVHAFSVTLKHAGAQTITVTDAIKGLPTGNAAVNLQNGPAASLQLSGIQGPVTAGTPSTFTVTVVDGFGNTVTNGFQETVGVYTNDSRATVATPYYTFTVQDAGKHTFQDGITFRSPGSWSLQASDGLPGIAGSLSPVLVQEGPPAKLKFFQQPPAVVTFGQALPTVGVAIYDAADNLLNPQLDVTLSLGSNPAGATLSGTKVSPVTLTAAVFPGLSLDKAGTGFTLRASAPGVPSADSTPFNVVCPQGGTGDTCSDWTVYAGAMGATTLAQAVGTDASGNVYVAGYTTGTLDGQVPTGTQDAFLAKYDAQGALQWTRLLGAASAATNARAVAVSADKVFVAGETTGSLPSCTLQGTTDAFVAAYALDGTRAWVRQLGGSHGSVQGLTRAFALAWDGAGALYVSGNTEADLGASVCTGTRDGYVASYDALGSQRWVVLSGAANTTTEFRALTVAPGAAGGTGTVYAAGWSQASNASECVQLSSFGAEDGSAAPANGHWTSQRCATGGNVRANGLTRDPGSGHLYVAGTASASMPTATLTGTADALLMEYDSAGTRLQEALRGVAGTVTQGLGITFDGQSLFLTGYATGALGGKPLNGSADLFLQRTTQQLSAAATLLIGSPGTTTNGYAVAVHGGKVAVGGVSYMPATGTLAYVAASVSGTFP